MSISKKLFGSITTIILSLIMSFSLYYLLTLHTETMLQEKKILNNFQETIHREITVLGKFSFINFDRNATDYITTTIETDTSFESLTDIIIIKAKSKTISDALNKMSSLKDIILTKRQSLYSSIELIKENSFGLSSTYSLPQMSTVIFQNINSETSSFNTTSYKFTTDLEAMYNVLTASIVIIEEQYKIVDYEIENIKGESQRISIIIGILLTLLGLIISVLSTRKVTKNIKVLDSSTIHLNNGDLSNRYELQSSDELGRLSKTLNNFLDNLSNSIREIQSTSDYNIQIKESLMMSFNESLNSIGLINSNVGELTGFSEVLNDTVNHSETEVLDIINHIKELQELLKLEYKMVESSSNAINKILGTINEISAIVRVNQLTTNQLVELSEVGEQKILNTNKTIESINDSLENIKGMSNLIKSISARTNLLAMNAAIEAAHAGEAGKGFSVVADEIRKLAEASALNSNTITQNIKIVVENIEIASRSSSDSAKAFSDIRSEIHDVHGKSSNILNDITGLEKDGSNVKGIMMDLHELTTKINNSSNDMSESINSVNISLNSLKNISVKVHNENKNILNTMEIISKQMNTATELGNSMGETSETLDNELKKFITI